MGKAGCLALGNNNECDLFIAKYGLEKHVKSEVIIDATIVKLILQAEKLGKLTMLEGGAGLYQLYLIAEPQINMGEKTYLVIYNGIIFLCYHSGTAKKVYNKILKDCIGTGKEC